ncbi:MAG: aminotransferase class V-fold PLP-dependent enzyme [Candidatus Hydrogenedentota bacterium]|nr:MAG: aminotransferase class V-fold PLP-dependent enzyme [Candidatus Hydrogenedentota bacterium]
MKELVIPAHLPNHITLKNIQEFFDTEGIYLNNAGAVPINLLSEYHIEKFLYGFRKKSFLAEEYPYYEIRDGIYSLLSNIINCNPNEIALIHNTAEGMNIVAQGLAASGHFSKGGKILLLEKEYPSNVYPWFQIAGKFGLPKQVEIEFFPLSGNKEDILEAYENKLKEDICLVSFSGSHWLYGKILPIEEMAELAFQRGIPFVLDGAQLIGHRPFSFKNSKVNVVTGSAWKWLMGPLGLAYFVIREDFMEKVPPVFVGTSSVTEDEEYLPYRHTVKESAERYMCSTPEYISWIYFYVSLWMIDQLGMERIYTAMEHISQLFQEALLENGFTIDSDKESSIIIATPPKNNAAEVVEKLLEKKVIVSLRGGKVRVSPYIYLGKDHAEEFSRLLKKVV